MLQVLCFGVGFLLFGVGSIVQLLKVLATPLEKRTHGTGGWEQAFYTILGLIILAWAYFQGAVLASKMNGLGF